MTWSEVLKQIDRLASYGDDWDGMGGVPPSSDAVCQARLVAKGMQEVGDIPPLLASPSSGGGIYFEWINKEPFAYKAVEIDGRGIAAIEHYGESDWWERAKNDAP